MRKRLNDSEMSLFASVPGLFQSEMYKSKSKPTENSGRGLGDAIFNGYATVVRKCRYAVTTVACPSGVGFTRTLVAMLSSYGSHDTKSVSVTIRANSDRSGFGIMDVTLNHKNDNITRFSLTAADARHLAQVLNAASNSCGATWRKSSITS